jgi:DNA polymerase, archaea type
MKVTHAVLIDADYVTKNGKAIIRLLLKRKRFFRLYDDSFEPYFYVDALDLDEAKNKLEALVKFDKGEAIKFKRIEKAQKLLRNKPAELLKVYCFHPSHVPLFRDSVREIGTPYEADIRFSRRYIIDKGLTPFNIMEIEREKKLIRSIKDTGQSDTRLNTLAFDIETYNPQGAPREKQDPAIMISYAGKEEGVLTYRETHKPFAKKLANEKEMIEEFLRVVKDSDAELLLGYNSTSFDLPYLKARADALGIKFALGRDGSSFKVRRRGMFNELKIVGRLHIDLYPVVRFLGIIGALRIYKFTLENAYQEITGKKKLMVGKLGIWQMWDSETERQTLADYSLGDSKSTLEIGQRILPMEIEISRLVRVPLFEIAGISTGHLVELFLVQTAFEHKMIVPNRPREEEVKEREDYMLQGAYVKIPQPGVYDNIAVFDFRGLYPSIISSHNIDPDMINCDCCSEKDSVLAPTGARFCKKRKGLIPEVLGEIVAHRSEIKKKIKQAPKGSDESISLNARQQALKVLANSFYGMLAYARSRWYSKECGEAVTAFGRHYIQDTAKMAEGAGFEVLYGDTDSIFLLYKGKTKEEVLEFLKSTNASLPGNMELELEAFYSRGVFVTKKTQGKDEATTGAKKKYALLGEDGNIKIRGFELVRRDWSPIAKRTQQKVLEAILKDGSKEKAVAIVKDIITDLKAGNVPVTDLVITNSIKKKFEQYELISPEIIVAEKLKERGIPMAVGSVVEYVITKSGAVSDELRRKVDAKRQEIRLKRNLKGKSDSKASDPISYRAEPVDFAKDYDADYYINNQILPSVLKILEELGYDEADLKFKGTQSSLGDF